jgi:hypothetical protein
MPFSARLNPILPTSLAPELTIADGFLIPCPTGSHRLGRGNRANI